MTPTAIHAQRKGIGLLETLLALFVAAIIIAGALLLYSQASQKRAANEMLAEL